MEWNFMLYICVWCLTTSRHFSHFHMTHQQNPDSHPLCQAAQKWGFLPLKTISKPAYSRWLVKLVCQVWGICDQSMKNKVTKILHQRIIAWQNDSGKGHPRRIKKDANNAACLVYSAPFSSQSKLNLRANRIVFIFQQCHVLLYCFSVHVIQCMQMRWSFSPKTSEKEIKCVIIQKRSLI